jgi:hypothetical protein
MVQITVAAAVSVPPTNMFCKDQENKIKCKVIDI